MDNIIDIIEKEIDLRNEAIDKIEKLYKETKTGSEKVALFFEIEKANGIVGGLNIAIDLIQTNRF